MTVPMCEYEGILQEWAPESRLLFQIPAKAQRGIFSYDLKLTSIDVLPDYIALGTNCGLVYWYNRQTAELQRLRFEDTNCSITCVKIVSTVDFMVAAGTDLGTLTVFQIPKKPPDGLPELLTPKNKQVERFTINGLHKSPVTCLEWSQNGMKLFSGDKAGTVVLTTIEFELNISKSEELLNEKFEVVQLSYFQQNLLISTIFRTVICHGNDNWRVTQIGSKERKTLSKFGAVFCKFEHGAVIYASRPGQRLWLATLNGKVEQTLIFKSALESTHPKIHLLNPISRRDMVEAHFGKLLQFGESCLVSYHGGLLHVLHPGAITVVATLSDARNVLDVAVNKSEIFILEGDRSLLRIGYAPDPLSIEDGATQRRKSFILDEFASKLKDTAVGSFKRITSDFMASVDKVSPPTIADEALDLPPIVSLPNTVNCSLFTTGNIEIHRSLDAPELSASTGAIPKRPVANQHFVEEEIINRPYRRRKAKKPNRNLLQGGGEDNESESDTMSTASEDRVVCGYSAHGPSLSEESPSSWSISQSQSSFSMLRDMSALLPHTCTPLQSDPAKTPEDRSQASIDTCESATENMPLTPDLFKEAQEKTFLRLTNQSMLDSLNSDRTENMSISVNLTPSSSASSKLSDHLSSEQSENVSMVSECDLHNEEIDKLGALAAEVTGKDCAAEDESAVQTPSISSEDSQDQRNKEFILSQILGLDLKDPLNRLEKDRNDKKEKSERGKDGSRKLDECATPIVDTDEFNSLLPESEQFLNNYPLPSSSENLESDVHSQKLESFESLVYGPPSGSSMVSSCHPSLDINTGPANLNNPQALVVERTDRWLQYKTPNNMARLTVCNNYVVCITTNDEVFYSQLSGISLKWLSLDYKASEVAASSDGQLVWFLAKRNVTALVKPSKTGPFSEEFVEVVSDACSIACDADAGYFVLRDGTIKFQINLNLFPCARTKDLFCAWKVKSITARFGILLAITTDDELICKKTPDDDFTVIKTSSKSVCSVALGLELILWIVDENNNVYFSDDFLSPTPHWWQVIISEYIFQNSVSPFLNMHNKMGNFRANIQIKHTMVAANDASVWIYNKCSNSVQVNKTGFTGCLWQDIPMRSTIDIVLICAHGVFEEKGQIWMLSKEDDIFCTTPSSPEINYSVSNPSMEGIICLSSAPETLWVLTGEGTVFARLGLSDTNLTGSNWRQLYLPQLADKKIVWVSCGCDVAWCVDISGRIFITLVPPYDIATNVFDAAWLEVDGKPKKSSATFVKVFVGPHMHMVWALDSLKQVYVREGIFSNYQLGTGWVHVGGIEAIHLSVSSTAVWAVCPGNAIYRRHGISENNFIGDYWRRVATGSINSISVTFDDDVWCINNKAKVSRLLQKCVCLETSTDKRNVSESEEKEWMVVE